MDVTALLIIGVALLVAITWFRGDSRRSAQRDLHDVFGVDPNARIERVDMGRGHGKSADKPLFADGLSGDPDVLFQHGRCWIVGEFKSATFRGHIRRRDYYQTTLYMGMVKTLHPRAEVEGRLVYANERRAVTFDPELYRTLLGDRAECLALLNGAGL